jgi:hypothetical protein
MRSIDVVTLRSLTSKAAEIQTSNRTRPGPISPHPNLDRFAALGIERVESPLRI